MKLKILSLSYASHISNIQQPQVANVKSIGQFRGAFLALQKVLLDTAIYRG